MLVKIISTAPWTAEYLGPPIDPASGWRVVQNDMGISTMFAFQNAASAQEFIAGLPETQEAADKVWASWYGFHGFMIHAGMIIRCTMIDRHKNKNRNSESIIVHSHKLINHLTDSVP